MARSVLAVAAPLPSSLLSLLAEQHLAVLSSCVCCFNLFEGIVEASVFGACTAAAGASSRTFARMDFKLGVTAGS
jgi:hypothetical protein